ncbi:MAG: hypothetical protein ABJC04_11940, partial [Verrucomicrobiota bacterium]
ETDDVFAQKQILVFTGKQREGVKLIEAGETPLTIESQRGRGRVTLLTFSPEREPFLSWKNRAWFWAKLADVPVKLYQSSDFNRYGGSSIDAVFGTIIDSAQVRKLPLSWLLLLLLVYLIVIGPLDYFWLKKKNRQMLTWITFPFYVAVFSVLIYFIGFQLRAGDSEYNELQVVDVFPHHGKVVLHGHTYASIYSPSNKRYALKSEQPFATLRGEMSSGYGRSEDRSRATILQRGNGFAAEVSVPVWTSQLYTSDWLQAGEQPMMIDARPVANGWEVSVENKLDRKLSETRVVLGQKIYLLGDVAAHENKRIKLESSAGVSMQDFVRQNGSQFFAAAQSRRYSFGDERIHLNPSLSAIALSFVSQLDDGNGNEFFTPPAGFDLSATAEQGSIILFAWDAGHLQTKPLNQFTPRRSHQDTLLRLVIPQPKLFRP